MYSSIYIFIFLVIVCNGCQQPGENFQLEESSSDIRNTDESELGATVTNRFGMTFHLVHVDPANPDHQKSYPDQPYYFQETTLNYVHLDSILQFTGGASFGDAGFPCEWRHCANLARILSEHDPDFDYRLPTQSQWSFACLNGYEQSCYSFSERNKARLMPEGKSGRSSQPPNIFGLLGLYDSDAECLNKPGHFMGVDLQDNPQAIANRIIVGNPDADDGLNEIIVARFILIPK